jgi:hypothetical protein
MDENIKGYKKEYVGSLSKKTTAASMLGGLVKYINKKLNS